MKTLKIFSPVWVKDGLAFFSITDWNFKKLGDEFGRILVRVYDGNRMAGWGIVCKKSWKLNAKLKERKVKLRPDEPLNFYYGIMMFEKMSIEDWRLSQFVKETCS